VDANKEDGTECNDDMACTTPDLCQDGVCVGSADGCDDELDCTVDTCEEPGGCVNTPDHDFCDDQNVCTGTETCNADAVAPGTGCESAGALDCVDNIDCTFDDCDAVDGCVNTPQDEACDDNNCCTADICDEDLDCQYSFFDSCGVDGFCCEEEDAECNDGNPCTLDTCDFDLHQCAASAMQEGAPCNDKDACTENTTCQGGACLGDSVDCQDAWPCTIDDCDPQSGCTNEPNHAACDDGKNCTVDTCPGNGPCQNLLSDNVCQIDGMCYDDGQEKSDNVCLKCDAGADPEGWTANDLVECDDDDPLTTDDECEGGTCTGLPDPDQDEIANSGYLQPCASGETDACNDNCPDVPNGDQADADGNGVGDVCDGENLILDLYEPCADISPAFKEGACTPDDPAYGDHSSSWRRTNEPVEIPLRNGIIDDSVVGYWRLDGNLLEQSGIQVASPIGAPEPTEPSPASGAFGDPEGAMQFNGTTDGVQTWKDREFRFGQHFTVQFFVKTNSTEEAFWVSTSSGDKAHDKGWYVGLFNDELGFGATNGATQNYITCSPPNDGLWHHVAAVRNGDEYLLFVDGALCKYLAGAPLADSFDAGNMVQLGHRYHFDTGGNVFNFDGSLDEVLLFNRALSPDEIETYYRSSAPYGTNFAPNAQADYDDVRVTESSGEGDPVNSGEIIKRSRIIGRRPHSDTPCPMAEDDGTWADREDLCGVVAYWKLDGDVADSAGSGKSGTSSGTYDVGAFGDPAGAAKLTGNDAVSADGDQLDSAEWTTEAWLIAEEFPADGDYAVLWQFTDVPDCVGSAPHLHVNLFMPGGKPHIRATLGHCGPDQHMVDICPAPVQIGQWHHLAVVAGADAMYRVYLDGALLECTVDHAGCGSLYATLMMDGKLGNNCDTIKPFAGRLDDVLVHSVAKSPDYIYHRANPGVPSARFLVDTEAQPNGQGRYDYKNYTLKWGNEDAEHVVPLVEDTYNVNGGEACVGLLSPCNGYAGWWRFNEGGGTIAVDSSTNKNNGALEGPVWEAAPESGMGLHFVADADRVRVDHNVSLMPEDVSIEFLLKQSSNNYWAVVEKCDYPGNTGYEIGVSSAKVQFRLNDESHKHTAPGIFSNEVWGTIAAAFDGTADMSSMYVSDGGSNTKPYSSSIGKNTQELIIGQYGHQVVTRNAILDSVRIMNRALAEDEFLHHPLTRAWGLPYQCVPLCAGKECGDDGCGGSCGDCGANGLCSSKGYCEEDGMVLVPAGKFWRGCDEAAQDCACHPREKPYKQIDLSSFWVDLTEVTAGDYQACVNAGQCDPAATNNEFCTAGKPEKSAHPANCVNWHQASDYCAWAEKRLCTEAEWEKAARGTNGYTYPWGNATPTCELVQMSTCGATAEVGAKPLGASPYGVLDMSGNVWEWIADYYDDDYYEVSPAADPPGPDAPSLADARVKRGGGWNSTMCEYDNDVRVPNRNYFAESASTHHLGIRCCADAD